MKLLLGNFTNMYFRIFLLLIGFPMMTQAGFLQRDVDFSNYDVPLYVQIVDQIKAKIAPRLGNGPLTRERYFIIPFAYQDRENHPEFSHSFISVIRVFADNNKHQKLRLPWFFGQLGGDQFLWSICFSWDSKLIGL